MVPPGEGVPVKAKWTNQKTGRHIKAGNLLKEGIQMLINRAHIREVGRTGHPGKKIKKVMLHANDVSLTSLRAIVHHTKAGNLLKAVVKVLITLVRTREIVKINHPAPGKVTRMVMLHANDVSLTSLRAIVHHTKAGNLLKAVVKVLTVLVPTKEIVKINLPVHGKVIRMEMRHVNDVSLINLQATDPIKVKGITKHLTNHALIEKVTTIGPSGPVNLRMNQMLHVKGASELQIIRKLRRVEGMMENTDQNVNLETMTAHVNMAAIKLLIA
jgi:hypothetical protein